MWFKKKNFFHLFAFKTVQLLRVIMHLIALSEAKKAGGENLAVDPERKLSQHHPRKRWARAGQSWQLYSILGLAGRKCLSNTSHDATGRRHPTAVQPLPSYKQWMNAKYNNLCELYLVCSAQTTSSISSLHRRWGLIKKTSDSYQHLHLPVLFDFAGEDTDLIWGHNLQCILVNVPVVVGQNKMFTTHSGTWQGLEALAVSSLPAYTSPVWRVLCVAPSLYFSDSRHGAHILSIVSLLLICKGYSLNVGQRQAGWRTQRSSAALSAL